jgi:hypothetical protein
MTTPHTFRIRLALLTSCTLILVTAGAIAQNVSDSRKEAAFRARARSIANSPVALKRSRMVIEEVDSDRYRLIPDTKEDQPLLTYTVYNRLFAGMEVTLDLFPDSRIRATWGDVTKLKGTYEGRIDEPEMQHLLDLAIQSGLAEPSGLIDTKSLLVPADSGSIGVRLRAKSLLIKDLEGERLLSPYDSKISTPSLLVCDKNSLDVSAVVVCRTKELQDDLFQIARSLAGATTK